MWEIIDSGRADPSAIMTKDALLLEQLHTDSLPIIHFYEWSVPCLTYGYFTDVAVHIDLPAMSKMGWQAAKRPTGGGIIFHLTDFAFSVIIPVTHSSFSQNTMENYAFVNHLVAQAIASLGSTKLLQPATCSSSCSSFCMATPTVFDLIIEGRKVGGAAQRRTKKGLLHQASLSLCPPPFDLLEKVLKNQDIVTLMKENSEYLFPRSCDLEKSRSQVKQLLVKSRTTVACLES